MNELFESKLLQFLSLIATELHEHNKLVRESNEIARLTVKEFKDETFKIDEAVTVAIKQDKEIKNELIELNKPIGDQ
jgi:uncharacterized coiled-coil DUF342 family protein